jgi:hypothetical protein
MSTAQPAGTATLRLAARYALSNGTPATSLKVALVVGTILNSINQGDALLNGGAVIWWKIALTYCVPYAVCTYGAVISRLSMEAPGRAV